MNSLSLTKYITVAMQRLRALKDHAKTAVKAGAQAVLAFLRRIDILSENRPVSAAQEALLLILAPLITFASVYILTSIYGVGYASGCNSASNFFANLLFRPEKPSTCQSVPFISDVPTVILSLTCPFAMVAYRLLRRRINRIVPALCETGLVQQPALKDELTKAVDRLESAVDLTLQRKLVLFAVTAAMTTWLYVRNLLYGHLFSILAISRKGVSNEAELRSSWWANYHHHLFLAALCIFIGTVGVYYAFRAGWLYLILGAMLMKKRKATPSALHFDYVPRWKDKSYGWSPVTGALFVLYLSTVNFAISMVAVFDMLQNRQWTIGVAAFFAVLGIVADLTIVLSSFFMMLGAHKGVQLRLRDSLVQGMKHSPGQADPLEYTIAATDLASWRTVPVASLSATTLKVIPGIYAFIQFVIRVLPLKH